VALPRRCTICAHDERHAIDVALVGREPYRAIARQYGVSKDALSRHTQEHLPELLARAKDAVEVAEADSLLSRVEGLYKRTETILTAAESNSEWGTALQAIRECRGNLELLGRVTKELESATTFNLHLNPEWLELRAVIVTALESHPDARESVLRALGSAGNVRD
jgi:hypothetical protein